MEKEKGIISGFFLYSELYILLYVYVCKREVLQKKQSRETDVMSQDIKLLKSLKVYSIKTK